MDPELKAKLDQVLELAKENNVMLRKVRRVQRFASITKVVYWIVILGVTFGAFYFLQPYLEQVTDLYQGLGSFQKMQSGIEGNLSSQDIKSLLESLR